MGVKEPRRCTQARLWRVAPRQHGADTQHRRKKPSVLCRGDVLDLRGLSLVGVVEPSPGLGLCRCRRLLERTVLTHPSGHLGTHTLRLCLWSCRALSRQARLRLRDSVCGSIAGLLRSLLPLLVLAAEPKCAFLPSGRQTRGLQHSGELGGGGYPPPMEVLR